MGKESGRTRIQQILGNFDLEGQILLFSERNLYMYQKIYHWASGNFYQISLGILLLLLLLEMAGIHRKENRISVWLWKGGFFCYMFVVLFLTLGSRIRLNQRHMNLHFHWEILFLAFQGKIPFPWEDISGAAGWCGYKKLPRY